MSDPAIAMPPTNEPLRVAVRRLHWFRSAFADYAQLVGAQIGCEFELDQTALTTVFVRWLRAVNKQKPSDHAERKDFFEFAAGLMLRELNQAKPLAARGTPCLADKASAAFFWPEGYAYTMFCIKLLTAAVEQEFHHRPDVSDAFNDLRQWWSYRENVAEEPTFAVGFLQVLMGHEPNWQMPDAFRLRLHRDLRPS
jgi:hypothetical protein